MKGLDKVLQGVLKFRKTIRKDLVKQFEEVRDNPQPTALFFTCMDSRILPSTVTQSNVGDMFVVRNSGNMIPGSRSFGNVGHEVSVNTEPAALELAVTRGKINHVIVCGHSDCKAINTLYNLHTGVNKFSEKSPMDRWLRLNGYHSLKKLEMRENDGPNVPLKFENDDQKFCFYAYIDKENKLNIEDKLSQINTLQQVLNIASHEFMFDYIANNEVFIHAMWFDIYTGNMYMFSKPEQSFKMIDEMNTNHLLRYVEDEMKGMKNNHQKSNNCC
ncbi:Carbonic anhydrase family-containing protein [Strongyloides ratti]|uniref:Carbonic anhydrase n=1 Tax=Strongyloides ratti TaxID=34506 RepID=A0A090LV46_STRRB|nr:Carbonic anhydrase family-containing protein [Strongyloides ratti]CEF71539.1 Carbonic anhydrase family-containing protein [Strongyloides ratti]